MLSAKLQGAFRDPRPERLNLMNYFGSKILLVQVSDMKGDGELIDEQRKFEQLVSIYLLIYFCTLAAQSTSSTENLFKPGPASTKTTCSHCKCVIMTKTENESSMQTHVVAVMLCP